MMVKVIGQKFSRINKRTNEVYCGYCGRWTFSRVYAQYKRLPLQCVACHRYYKWEK